METDNDNRSASHGYLVFVLVLCLASLLTLFMQAIFHFDSQSQEVFDYVDNIICVLFVIDFFVCLYRAEYRLRYLATWGWLDLLSCIPTLDVARWGRLARVFRIFRVLRAVRSGKVLATLIVARRAQSAILAAGLLMLLLIFLGSLSVLHFETGPDANIKSAEDAVWWAFTTMTTVGYGDRYPVSTEGRVIAVLLMLSGVGLLGILSGFLASWFLETDIAKDNHELIELRSEVAALRRLLEERLPVGHDQ